MGISQLPLLSFHSNGNQSNDVMSHSNGSLWSKLLKAKKLRKPRTKSILMRRRMLREGSRRHRNPIVKKVKTLKKLIPNNDSIGLDGLFRDTAEYISSLQTRVKVMQVMVKLLTGSSDD